MAGAGSTAAGFGVGDALKLGGRLASGASSGRAQGRMQEAALNSQYDRTGLEAARLNLQAPQMRAANSVKGDILAGVQPYHVSGPITHTGGKMPGSTGGLSPALLSQNSRQIGQGMSRDALLSQLKGDAYTPLPLPQSNGLDTALNIGGTLGALGESGLLRKIPKIGGWF